LDFHRDNPYDPAPLLRREFKASKAIKQAQAFISGIGYYELYLNGRRVGDRVLDPGWTDYRKTVLYASYDVTEYLKQGNNAVGVMLGRGHYGQTAVDHWGFYKAGGYIGQPKLKCLVRVTYADGTVENIISDRAWKVTSGPVVFDCPHMGEVYDATLEIKDWSQPGLDQTKWDQVEIAPSPGGKLISQLCEPIRVVKTFKPVKLEQRDPGEHWIDAGTNLAGWLRVKVNAPKGTRLLFYFGEKPDLMDYDQPAHYQQMGYVAKGEAGEIAECRFSYKGFRYALIKGHDQPLTLNEVDVCQVNSDVKSVGQFACDDQTLNAIHGLCVRALVANLHSVPTDCPHREKNGWLGDAVTGIEFGMVNYDLAALITKFTRDMFDTQDEQGRLSVIAPNNNYNLGASPLWSSACVHLPWYMFTYYGDTRLFETYWEQMMAYTRSVWAHRSMKERPGLFLDVLSDWSSPFGNRPDEGSEVYSSMNFFRVLKRLAHMGKLLDKQADVVLLEKQAEQIRAAIYEHCFDPEQKIFKGLQPTDYRQGPNALALHYGIVRPEHREAVQQRLIRDIRVDRANHIYGGIFTGLALWDLLPQVGQAELAYDVAMNNTYPSYGFMLENGATTLWEHWPDSSSHMHYFMGFVDNFFYRYVAGININEQNPGFSEIVFTPKLLSRLEHANANYQSIQGPVSISWQRTGQDVEIRITVPCNSRGRLILPEGVFADQGQTIELESGTHRIPCKLTVDAPSAKRSQRADRKESPSFQVAGTGRGIYLLDLAKQTPAPATAERAK
jgi:alpha-L-rhamnosidase